MSVLVLVQVLNIVVDTNVSLIEREKNKLEKKRKEGIRTDSVWLVSAETYMKSFSFVHLLQRVHLSICSVSPSSNPPPPPSLRKSSYLGPPSKASPGKAFLSSPSLSVLPSLSRLAEGWCGNIAVPGSAMCSRSSSELRSSPSAEAGLARHRSG